MEIGLSCYLWLKGKNSESKSQRFWFQVLVRWCCYLWLKGKNSESKSQLRSPNPHGVGCCYLWLKGKNSESKSQQKAYDIAKTICCYLWLKGKNSESGPRLMEMLVFKLFAIFDENVNIMKWLRKIFRCRKKRRYYTDEERFRLFIISQCMFHL